MMSDPLAQFRKIPAAASSAPKEPGEYVAFAGKDKTLYLEIRRANDPAQSPRNNFLLNVSFDDLGGTNFVIFYSFMIVSVRGANLQEMIKAIRENMCAFIQEFDPERWANTINSSASAAAQPCAGLESRQRSGQAGQAIMGLCRPKQLRQEARAAPFSLPNGLMR
jgi:hypothetical protein